MSTGISISSINRIKELAEEKKYAEALEILDTQNLDKSINPQFLRISGEIFRENKRYYDSRRILLKSHQMSPQGIRIIFELIQLYLELGYFTRARKYYEQYQFYSTPEDAQKDYLEYTMKKAAGAEVKELASILIPILERMPEDKWNFEAVLLYDKLGRKDKALEESQYILENFKDSIFVKPVIEYIDDKLDVDAYFYKYPKEEVLEDIELFGELIAEDDRLLEADYLRMYPPEARIMVEAEDKDAIETKPVKEKKAKKKRKRKSKETDVAQDADVIDGVISQSKGEETARETLETAEEKAENVLKEETGNQKESEEEQIKKEREAALEKLLSKKVDREKIKESAKQLAKSVKEIDTAKAKSQVMSVAETVKDNVKKATDVLGEAVGAKAAAEDIIRNENPSVKTEAEEQIVDGIIESVLEPPKKVVGQVLTNEELDSLIPDSLEAMSPEEIAVLEAKKEEADRLELEALEASLELEEAKKKEKQKPADGNPPENIEADSGVQDEHIENMQDSEEVFVKENDLPETDDFQELRAKFLAETAGEERPLDSLGFISVVQSDVDRQMEEEIPDTAGMLHQMIDNKEFYSGEDSTKFESEASYDNHGFEVEDYDFDAYLEEKTFHLKAQDEEHLSEETVSEMSRVEIIYAQETVVDFDEIVPEDKQPFSAEAVSVKETEDLSITGLIEEEKKEPLVAELVVEQNVFGEVEEESIDYPQEEIKEEQVTDESVVSVSIESFEDDTALKEEALDTEYEVVQQEEGLPVETETEKCIKDREDLKIRVLLSDSMVAKLLDLKESR